jgi:hypothetical protein
MNKKLGHHSRWCPENRFATGRLDFSPDDNAGEQLTQLLAEIQQAVKGGDPAICEPIDKWLALCEQWLRAGVFRDQRFVRQIEWFQLGLFRERLRYFADRDPVGYAETRTRILVHLGWGFGTYELPERTNNHERN